MNRSAAARVGVEFTGGRCRVSGLSASRFLAPRVVDVHGCRVRVALVGLCAMLLAGDDVRLDIDVGAGVWLELVEPSGTVAYDARGGRARWSVRARVGQGACLVWPAAPFVVAGGADVERMVEVELDHDAVMLSRETLVLGRSGERGGRFRAGLDVALCGRPLLVEDLDLRDVPHREAPGMLGANRVVSTVALLGADPGTPAGPGETTLEGPGGLARALSEQAHVAERALDGTWRRWREAVESGRRRVEAAA